MTQSALPARLRALIPAMLGASAARAEAAAREHTDKDFLAAVDKRYEDAYEAFAAELRKMDSECTMLQKALHDMVFPRSIDEAHLSIQLATINYEVALRERVDATRAWRAADVLGSRIRRGAVKRLMAPPHSMSATAADKAASDDEEYAKHKDHVAELLDVKDEAEAEAEIAGKLLDAMTTFVDLLASQQTVVYSSVEDNARDAVGRVIDVPTSSR